jgi:hypothetical protein
MLRRIAFLLTATVALGLRAAPRSAVLQDAVDSWLGERDRWAFTQRAVEYEDGVPHERVERFDPSKPGDARWTLLSVDGHAPTAEQRDKWAEKKFRRHHRKIDTPISEFFDFESARVVAETPGEVRFEVPLRRDKNWLFPTEKVSVRVTINKETRALEHLTAHVREPFKVLMGVAKVTGGELDLDFLNFNPAQSGPETSQPAGTARATVSRLGERIDFVWSDFTRVNPVRRADATEPKRGREVTQSP